MRAEDQIFLTVIVVMIAVFLFFKLFYPEFVFYSFLAELAAGSIGVLLGFTLNRHIELKRKVEISKKIREGILAELKNNLKLIDDIKILIQPNHIPYFELFQTNAWNMLSPRFEIQDIDLLFDLGQIYHRFELFNEGMKNEAAGRGLSSILSKNRKFLIELEKDVKNAIDRLQSLKI